MNRIPIHNNYPSLLILIIPAFSFPAQLYTFTLIYFNTVYYNGPGFKPLSPACWVMRLNLVLPPTFIERVFSVLATVCFHSFPPDLRCSPQTLFNLHPRMRHDADATTAISKRPI
ncbi:hypothetical protein K469DRAFT_346404 [Zopfia rhizophila CBS 207.26]|uniref:Uncharacterized protein n=1 Tax=Zopfia rhizophila CBS 207.26 TaxID=1314779 RepID=A0A6A6ELI9_9PEZI|nr:hypothetical protein K469DRAFT_346404 [Zopfia rhizophila CBS 207.26]